MNKTLQKISGALILTFMSLALSGCQSAVKPVQNQNGSVPYAKGPSAQPHVNGPTIPLPGASDTQVHNTATETENVKYTLP